MTKGFRLLFASASVAATVVLWASLVQAQTPAPPAQQPPAGSLAGLPVYSTDGTKLGEVIAVQTAPDGTLQAVQVEMGYLLGFGTSSVTIDPDDLRWRQNYIELPMDADDVHTFLMHQRPLR